MPTHVAVVGAGIAGLALARALQQHAPALGPPGELVVTVFNASERHSQISGYLRLPSARRALLSLGLGRAWDELDSARCAAGQRPGMVDFGALRRVLLRSLQPERAARTAVHWGVAVVGLARDGPNGRAGGRGVCLTLSTGGTRSFDLVVAADGLLSTTRRLLEQESSASVLAVLQRAGRSAQAVAPPAAVVAVGDARWIYGRWWNFDVDRRDRGGDTALTDAVGLADRLCYGRGSAGAAAGAHDPGGGHGGRPCFRQARRSSWPGIEVGPLDKYAVCPHDWAARWATTVAVLAAVLASFAAAAGMALHGLALVQ